jgi:Uma2 family endonuclease
VSAVQLKRWSRHAYDEMIKAGIFGPDERIELVEGEIVEMSPQDPPHSVGVLVVEEALRRAFPVGFHVRAQLPLALDDDSEPEPDLAVVRGDIRDYVANHPATAVLIVEVAHSTLDYDRRRKARIYARAGIPEYWIVNLVDRVVEVYREPQSDGTYAVVERFGDADTVSSLTKPDSLIDVNALLP